MLVYIKTQRDDLRICDFCLYKQQYCALCQGIGKKYGIVYRLILSYDMVFLALVLENFETEMTPLSFKCPTNPFKKINTSISNNVIEYCAFINYYLSVLKLEDDIIDEKNNVKKIILKFFKHNSQYQNILNTYGAKLNVLSELMSKINSLESENACFDQLSNLFGEFFVELFQLFFKLYKEDCVIEKYDNLYSLCFNLGKWIYIIDAYEDYNEDMQNGNFNLLQNIMKEDDSDNKLNAHKKIAMINKILILKMEKSFHEITWNKYKEILYNIVSLVCTNTYFKILHEKYPEIESIIRCI